MSAKPKKPLPHPDDFMVVTVSLAFQAKLNPEVDDPPPFDATEIEESFLAADAAEYLERVVSAIRERRVYGFMMQEQAESAVGAGDWIEKPVEEVIAEATAKDENVRLPHLQMVVKPADD